MNHRLPALLGPCLLLCAAALPTWAQDTPAPGSDWNVMLGVSAGDGPSYLGSEERDGGLAPFGTIDYKGIVGLGGSRCVDGMGLYVRPIQTERVTAGLLVVHVGEREADDAKALRGMGDRRSVVFFGADATFDLGVCEAAVEVVKGGRDDAGLTVALELSRSFPLSEKVSLGLSTTGIWGDEDHVAWDFAISPTQAAKRQQLINAGNTYLRQKDARPFKPGSGFTQAKAGASLDWQATQHWVTSVSVEYGRIVGDAADSPLTRKADQLSSGATLMYRF